MEILINIIIAVVSILITWWITDRYVINDDLILSQYCRE